MVPVDIPNGRTESMIERFDSESVKGKLLLNCFIAFLEIFPSMSKCCQKRPGWEKQMSPRNTGQRNT